MPFMFRTIGGGILLFIRVVFLWYSNKSTIVLAETDKYGPPQIQVIQIGEEGETITQQKNTQEERSGPLNDTSKIIELPESIKYIVPFFSQAPLGNRNYPFREACEETAFLLGWYYLKGITPDKYRVSKDILSLVDVQNKTLGFYKDTTVTETQSFINERDDSIQTLVIENPDETMIKQMIHEGYLILAPLSGPDVKNPHYGKGVVYHMILITGYNEKGFITHDVGTSRGENWVYSTTMIMKAINDYNHTTNIANGGKRILAIK